MPIQFDCLADGESDIRILKLYNSRDVIWDSPIYGCNSCINYEEIIKQMHGMTFDNMIKIIPAKITKEDDFRRYLHK